QAEDGIRDLIVTGVQTCALPILHDANAAGGKDNISVVYVEGERFASGDGRPDRAAAEITRRLGTNSAADRPAVVETRQPEKAARSEERRVGKEGRCGRWRAQEKK